MQRDRRLLIVVACSVAAALIACRDPSLQPSDPRVRAAVEVLELPPARVGGASETSLTLLNRGVANGWVTLEVEGPFEAAENAPTIEVPGGSALVLRVRFRPTAAGPAEGLLRLGGDGAGEVALRAEGVTCVAAHACEEVVWNADEGRCESAPRAEGTACTSACVTNGTCAAGTCIGEAPDCDDGNACTLDGCDTTGACLHVAVRCAGQDDPCNAPYCDPVTGCGIAPVADGTACGATNCTVSRVCIAGACEERPAVDGTPCGLGSPCQAAGTCQAGECARPPPEPLEPEWLVPLEGAAVRGLVVDDRANAYWFETNAVEWSKLFGPERVERGWMTSVAPDGTLRFREPVYALPSLHAAGYALTADWANAVAPYGLVSTSGYDIELRDALTGQLKWSVDIPQLLAAQFGTQAAEPRFRYDDFAVSPTHIHLAVFSYAARRGWLLSFDPSGQLAWAREHRHVGSLVLDDAGNLYARTADPDVAGGGNGDTYRVTSWAANGTVRWRTPGFERPAGFLNGRLLANTASSLIQLDAASGAATDAPAGLSGESCPSSPKRFSAQAWAMLTGPVGCCGPDCQPGSGYRAYGVELLAGGESWRRDAPVYYGGGFQLTDADLLLVTEMRSGDPWQIDLLALDRAGDEVFRCPYRGGDITALGRGRFFTNTYDPVTFDPVVAAYAMPFGAAEHGWSTDRGGPGGTGAAGR